MTDAQQSSAEAFADLLCGLSKLSLPPQPLYLSHYLHCHQSATTSAATFSTAASRTTAWVQAATHACESV